MDHEDAPTEHRDGDASVTRIAWSTASQGARVVPILLIHGAPVVIVPEGLVLTGITAASPAGWWPGSTFATWSAFIRPWLSLRDGLRISEAAHPGATNLLDVSEVTVYVSDVDGAATALFESVNTLQGTYLTSSLSATATTIPVLTTAGFANSGTIYLGQEAIDYAGKTATTFATCTRGRYGSLATRHLFSDAQGAGLGNPQVTSGLPDIIGRPATLWLAEVSTAGVITALQLEHFSTVGTGVALAGGGSSTDDGYVLSLDHAVKRMGQTIRANAITVGGYVHVGNAEARATLYPPSASSLTPVWVYTQTSSTVDGLVVLTDDAAYPDLGGWHPTREAYVTALDAAGRAVHTAPESFSATLEGDVLRIRMRHATSSTFSLFVTKACDVIERQITGSTVNESFGRMREAWVPIGTGSRVYVSQGDYAIVPGPPTLDASASLTNTTAQFCLVFGDEDDPTTRRVARITGSGTVGPAYYLLCSALDIGSVTDRAIYTDGFIITEPSPARLALCVTSDSWVAALRYTVQSLDVEYASIADAIDWTRMQEVADAYPSALPQRREMLTDLNTSLLSMLQNEAALNGFTLVMHEGRIAIARIAEFASTESTSTTLSSASLDASSPSPEYLKGDDGIVNAYSVRDPNSGVSVTVQDETSRARFGGRGIIEAVMPRTITNIATDGSLLYTRLFAQGAQVLGPLRYPYRHVRARFTLNTYDLQIGDVVTLSSMWRIPNGSGTRGVVDAVAQIIAREVSLYESDEGNVTYTFRLNPNNLTGYAPTLLVAAGGITGAVVTADTTTLGAGGFAGVGTDGGASTFKINDVVRLVEIDNASPTASTQHTVSAVSGSTITLNPAPSGTFATLAASALKVVVEYDDFGTVVSSGNIAQRAYAFLGGADATLDSNNPARIFAA